MRTPQYSTKSLETRKIRKILNEEARLGITQNSDSETEQVDLQKELYPLSHYISNREEMIEQMFSIIKGAKLKKMLPPMLKNTPLDELKADCLIHLIGMSKKRIRAILEGREINSSSDSETHSDSSNSPSKKQKIDLRPFTIKQEGCSDISDNSEEVVLVDPDLDIFNVTSSDKKKVNIVGEKKKSKRKVKRKDLEKKQKRSNPIPVEEKSTKSPNEVQQIDSSTCTESVSENEAAEAETPTEGKTLLEILELEMRARAIRALLKNSDTKEEEPKSHVEEGSLKKPALSCEKSRKHLTEGISEKVTPAKNFRKKKRKSDDVVIIAPKLITIDLTDENDQSNIKSDSNCGKQKNVSSISPINSTDNKSHHVLPINSSETVNEFGNNNVSSETIGIDKESPKLNEETFPESVASCSYDKINENEGLDKTVQSDNVKSSWAQRWLDSKEVKKVVSTSKICGNIRKRIKIAKLAKKNNLGNPVEPSPPPQQIEGSVDEYQLLSKSKVAHIPTNCSDTQEPTSSEEMFSADQVQDVTSTKSDNSVSTTEDTATAAQIISSKFHPEGSNNVISKSGLPCEVFIAEKNSNGTDLLISPEIESKTDETDVQGTKYIDNKNEKNSSERETTKFPEALVINSENEILNNEEREKGILELPVQMLPNENCKTHEKVSAIVSAESISNTQDNLVQYKSGPLFTEPATTILKTIDDCETNILEPKQIVSRNIKSDLDSNSEFIKKSEIEIVSADSNEISSGKAVDSKLSQHEINITSVNNLSPNQEVNESEALEINITDEDRDIEEVNERG